MVVGQCGNNEMNAKIGLILRLNQVARRLSAAANARVTHYDTLGVKPTATAAEIKIAYYEKTKLYHPDAVKPTEENLKIFRQISEAYEVIGSSASRKEYDENILGITSNEDAIANDPIAEYKRKTLRHDMGYTWTRNYCEHLRMRQSGGVAAAARNRETTDESPGLLGLIYVIGIVLTFVLFVNKDSSRISEIQKRHQNK